MIFRFHSLPSLRVKREMDSNMNDPTTGKDEGNPGPPPPDAPSGGVTPGQTKGAELPTQHQQTSEANHDPAPKSLWGRWQEHTLAERIMAYFTAVVAVCAALQVWILIGGSGQTDQLIKAADINACAAQKIASASSRNAKAAEDFAHTAGSINSQMADTVKKLNLQASRLEESAKQTARLATDTEIANKQAIGMFKLRNRPWVGVEGDVAFDENGISWVGPKGEEEVRKEAAEGRLPKRVIYHLKNFGDGPAFNTMLVVQPMTFPYVGGDDIYIQVDSMIEKSCRLAEQAIAKRNGDLLLPGGEHPVPFPTPWDSSRFLFTPGCIVYKDVDGEFHHTGICYAVSMFLSPEPKGLESCGSRMPAD